MAKTSTPLVDQSGSTEVQKKGQHGLVRFIQQRGAIVVLIIFILFSSFLFKDFLSVGNLENILIKSSFLGLIVVGETLVIISGGIDLTVGSMVALGAVMAAYSANIAWPLGLIVPAGLGGIIGLINGMLIAKAKMPPFIVTLAGLLGIQGLALAISGEQNIPIKSTIFTWFGQGEIFGIGVPVFFMILAFIVAGIVLSRMRYGKALFAIGGNEESAKLMGINVDRVKIIAYTTSGLLAGLSGALLAGELWAGQPTLGSGWELQAISAVVVGGTLLTGGSGSMSGSLAGVLLLNIIQNLINLVGTLGSYAQQLVSGIFLVIVVVAQAYLTRKQKKM